MDQSADRELAADLAQDTFIQASKAQSSFDETRDLKTWLFSIAKNLLVSYYRRVIPLSIQALEERGFLLVDESISPEDRVICKERDEALRTAMAKLGDDDCLALACVAYDVPRKEAAKQLGISVRALDTRIWRAKKRLRALL